MNTDVTVVEQFTALAHGQSDYDATLYAAEAALKAAGWAPDLREEQRRQAGLLRQIVGRDYGDAAIDIHSVVWNPESRGLK